MPHHCPEWSIKMLNVAIWTDLIKCKWYQSHSWIKQSENLSLALLYKLYQFGIRDKLWHLLKEWLTTSKCRVLYDGQLPDKFGVSRGVKQGGIMSMFLFGISIFDIHNHINQSRDGLQIDDTCMSSPLYADDIVLLSNMKNGLQKMMNYIHIYGNKWQISFSASKTKCMVFGETKLSKTTCMSSQSWELGGSSVCETESFVHLGIQINAYLDTTNKVKEMCKKGKGTYFSLTHVGVKPNGLNPLTSANIWNKIGLPSSFMDVNYGPWIRQICVK